MILEELFRIPLNERREDIAKALKPYVDRDDIFITYSDIAKVGINPMSGHDTPIGIYAYPLKEMFEEVKNNTIPYASDRSYVHVLAVVGRVQELSTYTISQWETDQQKLRRVLGIYVHDHFENAIYQDRVVAFERKWGRDGEGADEDNPEPPTEDETWAAFMEQCGKDATYYRKATNQAACLLWATTRAAANLYSWQRTRRTKNLSKTPVVWNGVFRAIGYQGITDRAGQGIIHTNEPTQAVFFSTKAIRHVAMLDNVRKLDRTTRWAFERFSELVSHMRGGDDDYMDRKHLDLFMDTLRKEWLPLLRNGVTEHFTATDPENFLEDATSNLYGFADFANMALVNWKGALPDILTAVEEFPELNDGSVWSSLNHMLLYAKLTPQDMKLLMQPEIIEKFKTGMDMDSGGFKIASGADVDMLRTLLIWAIKQGNDYTESATVASVKRLLRPILTQVEARWSDEELAQIVEGERDIPF